MALTNSRDKRFNIPLINPGVNLTRGSELDDLIYDLTYPSTFFEKPLQVDIPHLETKVEVGNGFGGFSGLYFQRRYTCTLCGRCCRNNVRGSWFWFDWEPCPEESPSGTPFVHEEIGINGTSVGLRIYRNPLHPIRCEFLQPINDEQEACSIHLNGQKNTLCRTFLDLFPQYQKEHTPEGITKERLYFSKRLGSRNWLKPQCPAEWTNIDDEQKKWDEMLIWRYAKLIEQVPGNYGWDIYQRFMWFYDQQNFYKASGGSQLLKFEEILKWPIYSE